ncbi:MAG: phage virion morphogenesis protein [Flavobacteriales bacterium]|nr:phage virion morphogenesis protein [Flavobacteriales bacterium]
MPVHGIKNLDQRLLKVRSDLVNKLPKKLGQAAETHFRESFKKGGFTDRTFVKWKPRARPPMNSKGKVRNHTVLYQHGLLRNSVRLVRYNWDDIQVVAGGSHVPYAAIHNEGGTISKSVSVRAYDRRRTCARPGAASVAVRASEVGAPPGT